MSEVSNESIIDSASARLRLAGLNRPPWDVLSSAELADILGISIQVLANWRIRKRGPTPEPRKHFRGNKTYYRVFEIERWLRGLEVTDAWRVVAEWLMLKYFFPEPLETPERTWTVAEQLRSWKIWPLVHRPRRNVSLVQHMVR